MAPAAAGEDGAHHQPQKQNGNIFKLGKLRKHTVALPCSSFFNEIEPHPPTPNIPQDFTAFYKITTLYQLFTLARQTSGPLKRIQMYYSHSYWERPRKEILPCVSWHYFWQACSLLQTA